MGKIKKVKSKKFCRDKTFDLKILQNKFVKPSSRSNIRNKRPKDDECEIQKQKQVQEDSEEEFGYIRSRLRHPQKKVLKLETSESDKDTTDHSEDHNIESSSSESSSFEEIQVTEDDEKAFEKFMNNDAFMDVRKEKHAEKQKQTKIYSAYSDSAGAFNEDLEENGHLYKALVPSLNEYESGELPEDFKIIPEFRNWEKVVLLTEPEMWSTAAMQQATILFSSKLKDKIVERFYNLILLPRLRHDIAKFKKLNYHLYQALITALLKPAAFFKGIILPLCENSARSCSLREAILFGSVLTKMSIPILYSSAALMRLSEMEYTGASSIFMRVLLEKKYALSFRVINAVVDHFMQFIDDEREYPLFWHQCLLTFVQIYKDDLSNDQRQDLLKLLNVHKCAYITREIRGELHSSSTSAGP